MNKKGCGCFLILVVGLVVGWGLLSSWINNTYPDPHTTVVNMPASEAPEIVSSVDSELVVGAIVDVSETGTDAVVEVAEMGFQAVEQVNRDDEWSNAVPWIAATVIAAVLLARKPQIVIVRENSDGKD